MHGHGRYFNKVSNFRVKISAYSQKVVLKIGLYFPGESVPLPNGWAPMCPNIRWMEKMLGVGVV